MKLSRIMLTAGLCLAALGCRHEGKALESSWIAQLGGRDPDLVFDVVETSDRRLCATGTFANSASFGPGKTGPRLEAAAFQDIFVACYTRDGDPAWVRQLGTRRGDGARALAALPDGDILVTGFFADTLAGGSKAVLHADNGNADVFLVRLDDVGNEVWSRRFGGKLADTGYAVAVADDGNILLAGSFQDTMFFDVDGRKGKLNSAGSRDAFVMNLDPDGRVRWARRFGGQGSDEATAVAAGRDGQVLVAGSFQAEATIDGTTEPLSAVGSSDALLVAFSADGETLWSRRVAGEQREIVSGLATDSLGRIFMAGTFQNEIELPDGHTLQSAGSTDVFVVRFAPDGDVQTSFSFGNAQIEQLNDLAMTSDGTLLLAGMFQGELRLTPDARGLLQAPGPANSDGFVVALDADGNYRAAASVGGRGVELVMGVVALAEGGVGMSGVFGDDLSSRAVTIERIKSRGKTDGFVARINTLID